MLYLVFKEPTPTDAETRSGGTPRHPVETVFGGTF